MRNAMLESYEQTASLSHLHRAQLRKVMHDPIKGSDPTMSKSRCQTLTQKMTSLPSCCLGFIDGLGYDGDTSRISNPIVSSKFVLFS